jgi:c-di-GMP-binding flagellar brake protein YcgR
MNDIVKVASFSQKLEEQNFIAQVFYSTNDKVKLFNATVIQTTNNRKHFRVPTEIKAMMRIDGYPEPVKGKISNISAGGLKMETGNFLDLGMKVVVEFVVHNHLLSEACAIRRAIRGIDMVNIYGFEFLSLCSEASQKINQYLFNQQSINLSRNPAR